MIEAELKARVHDPERVCQLLAERAVPEVATYHDTYYDWPDRSLTSDERELRLRIVETDAGRRNLLTYKEPPADKESSSKPEYETRVDDGQPVDAMLRGLGLGELVRLTKYCHNYRFTSDGRDMLATLVTVPELDGTYLEVETLAEPDDLDVALAAVQDVLTELGLIDHLDPTDYTEAVIQARSRT